MCLDVGSLLPKPKADSVSSRTACIMLTPPGGHAATQHQKARVLNITFAWNDLLYFICFCFSTEACEWWASPELGALRIVQSAFLYLNV